MAKSRAKSDDTPTIAVRVEQGRLVAMSQYDQELLSQWREGAILNVDPVLAQTRPLERRYFAALSHLLKVAETPWTNVPAAHDAIKLATGFVEPHRKKSGEWGARPRHIATFTDAELSEYYELFCGIVRKRFGIDPETLQREAADTGSSSEDAVTPADPDDDPGVEPIPPDAGDPISGTPSTVSNPAVEGAPETGGNGLGQPLGSLSSVEGGDAAWLKMVARMLVAATEPGGGLQDAGIIDRQANAIKQTLTPPTIGQKAKDKATKIYRHCLAACIDSKPFDKEYVARTAGCRVEDLRPEAR